MKEGSEGKIAVAAPEAKTPAASKVEMTEIVLPTHTNFMGTVFGGQITAWIDVAGAVAAMRHAGGLAVTASMDQMHFLHGAHTGDVVVLRAQVNYCGRSSMEVGVRVECEEPLTGARYHTATAYLTFVAIDDAGKPRAVPELALVTEADRRRHEKARVRRERRLSNRKEVLDHEARKPPCS